MDFLDREPGKEDDTFRKRMLACIESNGVQTFLTVLLLIDIITVIIGVALDAEYPNCQAALRVCGLDENHECVEASSSIMLASDVLWYMSNFILTVFVLEIILTALGVGLFTYVCTPTYLIDSVVVFASLAIELTEGSQRHDTGLLVLARAWRFVTLIHGMNQLHEDQVIHRATSRHQENENEYGPITT